MAQFMLYKSQSQQKKEVKERIVGRVFKLERKAGTAPESLVHFQSDKREKEEKDYVKEKRTERFHVD